MQNGEKIVHISYEETPFGECSFSTVFHETLVTFFGPNWAFCEEISKIYDNIMKKVFLI